MLFRSLDRRGVVVRQEDIGDLVSRTCADLRASTAQRLQAELSQFAAGAPGWEDALGAFEELRTPLPDSGRRATRLWLLVGSLLLAVTAGVGFYLFLVARDEPEAVARERAAREKAADERARAGPPGVGAREPPSPEPVAPPAPVGPAQVHLTVTVTPPEALVFLDGQRLAQAPTLLGVPRDEREHELRVEAEGHEPLTRRVRFDSDLELILELVPALPAEPPRASSEPGVSAASKKRPRRPPAAAAPAAREETPSAEPAEPAAPACDPPYFIAADGVKRYRPECL